MKIFFVVGILIDLVLELISINLPISEVSIPFFDFNIKSNKLILIVISVFLIMVLIRKRALFKENMSQTKMIYQSLNSVISGKRRHLYFFVYTLFHIAWIGDLFLDINNVQDSLIMILTLSLGWTITLLLIWEKPRPNTIEKNNRALYVTAISKMSIYNKDGNVIHNLTSSLMPLMSYTNIKEVLMLQSKELYDDLKPLDEMSEVMQIWFVNHGLRDSYDKLFEAASKEDRANTYKELEGFMRVYSYNILGFNLSKDIKFRFSEMLNFADYQMCYESLKFELLRREYKKTEGTAVFNITAGTSAIVTLLSVLSLYSSRIMCFVDQTTHKVQEIEPPIEVYNELFVETSKNNINNPI